MQNTIKQAVGFICEQAARRYAPKIWLKVPFTVVPKKDNDEYLYVEVKIAQVTLHVIWDPKAPSPYSIAEKTCIIVADGFGNIVATAYPTKKK